MALDFWEVTINDFHQAGGDYICSCPVVENAWHNLDRREARSHPQQAAKEALEDLNKLPQNLQYPVLFHGICPHPDFAAQYHKTLSKIADEVNSK
jgi:hypothetical protein